MEVKISTKIYRFIGFMIYRIVLTFEQYCHGRTTLRRFVCVQNTNSMYNVIS